MESSWFFWKAHKILWCLKGFKSLIIAHSLLGLTSSAFESTIKEVNQCSYNLLWLLWWPLNRQRPLMIQFCRWSYWPFSPRPMNRCYSYISSYCSNLWACMTFSLLPLPSYSLNFAIESPLIIQSILLNFSIYLIWVLLSDFLYLFFNCS